MNVNELEGPGLHSGKICRVRIHEDKGPIRFRLGNTTLFPLIEHVIETPRCTTLTDGSKYLSTVEHLLSALYILEIFEGLVFEVDGPELPILDGSAQPWADLLAAFSTAFLGQGPTGPFHVRKNIHFKLQGGAAIEVRGHGIQDTSGPPNSTVLPASTQSANNRSAGKLSVPPHPHSEQAGSQAHRPNHGLSPASGTQSPMALRPDNADHDVCEHRLEPLQLEKPGLNLCVRIDFPHPAIGHQHFCSPPRALVELLNARTFGFLSDHEALLKSGLARGASLDNIAVFDTVGPLNSLRGQDEPVRHKALDFLGDLYLVGVPIVGSVEISRGSHRLHHRAVKALREQVLQTEFHP